MKSFILLISSVLFMINLISCSNQKQKNIDIIPAPVKLVTNNGMFLITAETKVFSAAELEKSNYNLIYLNEQLNRSAETILKTAEKLPDHNFIHFKFDKSIGNKEGYNLIVGEDGIVISASTSNGIFYGIQTLLQLLPPEIYSQEKESFKLEIPIVEINDEPRFEYRGVHLDVGRHLYSVADIKKYIDYLAMHKISKFHWHLTEDQGWRIEIKKYPKLTSVGAWRNETMGDGKKYGGFYTQEEVKEIVEYAKSRFIEVIPEIELPGHSVAALAAYPEFSCTGGPFEVETTWGVHKDVYCAGNEKTFKFLEEVFDEVIPLFPSKYIHIGGDECPKDRWKECSKCQARIKAENLKDEHELQSYFIQRMEKYILSKGKQIIGWDEILEGGLAPQATVMSWRGEQGGIEAAKQNHDVIMTPGSHCYFDHHQGDPAYEPHSFGGRLTLTKVYSYEPIPKELTEDQTKYILGAQANMWTERLPEFSDVEYMLLPRLAAMSEVLWSTKENKNYGKFVSKMETQLKRYDYIGANYSKSAFNVSINTAFNEEKKTLDISMNTELGETDIYYTIDGTEPNENSLKYKNPIHLKESAEIKAVAYKDGKLMSKVTSKDITIHKAFGKKIELTNPYSEKYASNGKYSLVNGLFGTNSFQDSYWQGYEGNDFEAVIDLENNTNINSIETGFNQDTHSWVFLPAYVEYSFSEDGENFSNPIKIQNDIDPKDGNIIVKRFIMEEPKKDVRFIKVFAKNIGVCPPWHQGAGGKAWLFVDEIFIK